MSITFYSMKLLMCSYSRHACLAQRFYLLSLLFRSHTSKKQDNTSLDRIWLWPPLPQTPIIALDVLLWESMNLPVCLKKSMQGSVYTKWNAILFRRSIASQFPMSRAFGINYCFKKSIKVSVDDIQQVEESRAVQVRSRASFPCGKKCSLKHFFYGKSVPRQDA